jgi:hypothetical protein
MIMNPHAKIRAETKIICATRINTSASGGGAGLFVMPGVGPKEKGEEILLPFFF